MGQDPFQIARFSWVKQKSVPAVFNLLQVAVEGGADDYGSLIVCPEGNFKGNIGQRLTSRRTDDGPGVCPLAKGPGQFSAVTDQEGGGQTIGLNQLAVFV